MTYQFGSKTNGLDEEPECKVIYSEGNKDLPMHVVSVTSPRAMRRIYYDYLKKDVAQLMGVTGQGAEMSLLTVPFYCAAGSQLNFLTGVGYYSSGVSGAIRIKLAIDGTYVAGCLDLSSANASYTQHITINYSSFVLGPGNHKAEVLLVNDTAAALTLTVNALSDSNRHYASMLIQEIG